MCGYVYYLFSCITSRKTKILNELTMILNAFLKKMKSIEELELAELKALKAKTNDLENTCSEMRMAMVC